MNPVKTKLPIRLAVLVAAGSLTLSPLALAKHATFDLPACDRLMNGDSSDSDKTGGATAAADSAAGKTGGTTSATDSAAGKTNGTTTAADSAAGKTGGTTSATDSAAGKTNGATATAGSDAAGKTGEATAAAGSDAAGKTGEATAAAGSDTAGKTGEATAAAGSDAAGKTGEATAAAGSDTAGKTSGTTAAAGSDTAGKTGEATAAAGSDAAGKTGEATATADSDAGKAGGITAAGGSRWHFHKKRHNAAAGKASGTTATADAAAGKTSGTAAAADTAAVDAAAGKHQSSTDLSPLKLTNDQNSYSVGKDGQVKMTVQENVSHESPSATATDVASIDKPESVIKGKDGDLSKKLLKEGKAVNIGPLPLLEADQEAQKKADVAGDAERIQLTDLWTATINRSPDIQFVINRLQPNSDPKHATATAVRMLTGALFSAAQAVPMMLGPGMGSMLGYAGTGSGASIMNQLMYGNEQKNQKKQQISQEQATILYKIVRDTADKLVVEFHKYKKSRATLDRASQDLEDLKSNVAQALGQDATKQIELEYYVRKAERDVADANDDASMHRQALSDLAGPDAVAKLDDEMEQQAVALMNLTGGSNIKQDLPVKPEETAQAQVKPEESTQTAAKPGAQIQ